MHILVTNDDGPPSNQSSPYVHSLIESLKSAGHTVSVVLPHQQRSWIGKAHLVGASVRPTYFRPGTLHQDDGAVHPLPRGENDEDGDEWILIDSTPASCVQIGLFHYFQDRAPIDVVVSGPNYGRNTTALFALSSGTLGAALEAAVCGKRSIALSYAFSSRQHDPVVIAEASKHSVRLIEYLCKNWTEGVDLYSINVPLEPGVSKTKVLYTSMLDNRWSSGSCFQAVDPNVSGEGPELQERRLRGRGEGGETSQNGLATGRLGKNRIQHKHFKWSPNFADVYKSVDESEPGNDGWVVKAGMTSVTPLRANFMHTPGIQGEIMLSNDKPVFYAIVDSDSPYVQKLVLNALSRRLEGTRYQLISSVSTMPNLDGKLFQYREYERLDFNHLLTHPSTSVANAYVIRKALIRKHFLSSTIANWVSKNPGSVLQDHFKQGVHFELDYAEYLDEALLEAYELRASIHENEAKSEPEKQWWILKPGMSDRGQGIRLFSSEDRLREIFEEWEDSETDDEGGSQSSSYQFATAGGKGQEAIISQLRHFVAQPYIDPPLLLPSSSNRKFHIRVYVLAVGALKVYVFREMLALFAAKPYCRPCEETDDIVDLATHLTNTCLQEDGDSTEESVRRYWDLDDDAPELDANWKQDVFKQICDVTGEVFEAAARGMMVHFQTLPNAFELFGVDFLVDSTGTAWLLELNAFPDFAQTGEELRDLVVGRLFEETIDVAVKPFFSLGEVPKDSGFLKLVAELDLGRRP